MSFVKMINKYKNKHSKLMLFIKMFVLFIIISIFLYFINSSIFFEFLRKYIPNIKLFGGYIYDIIKELILFAIVMSIIIFNKQKHYSVIKKKEKFWKSILKGWPIFLCILPELLFLLYEIIFIDKGFELFEAIGLLCYCFTIGLTEEFLCRKFVQNEFVSESGKTQKKVLLPIFLSSIFFGLLHFTNFFIGQSMYDTIIQMFHGICWSMVIGIIYYKTKNIWSIVWIHAIYDFIVKFDQILSLNNWLLDKNSFEVETIRFIAIVLSMVIFILYALKMSKINNNDETIIAERKNNDISTQINRDKKYDIAIIVLIIIYILMEMLYISLHLK